MAKGKGRFVLFVLFGFLLLGAGSAGAIVWGLGSVAKEIEAAPGFAAGWGLAATNPTLIDAIGTPRLAPFNLVEFVAGRQPWAFTASQTERKVNTETTVRTIREETDLIEVPITGPNGTGSLSIEAVQSGTSWDVKKLEARIAGRAEPIDLLAATPSAQAK